jgi:hypothetical protein
MKNIYTSLFLMASFATQAQITIDISDMPVIGDVINRKADTMTVLSGPGNAGANQTWNFTQLSTFVNDETSTAVEPSTTPYASQYANSNLALTDGNGGYVYFNQSANAILVKGIAGQFPGTTTTIVAPLNPDQTLHNLPRTYGSHFTDGYVSDITFSGASISPLVNQVRVKRTGTIHDTTDAWGSLTTPVGTYDVIRVKKVDFTTDSVWIQAVFPPTWQLFQTSMDTVTTYQWLAKGGKLPIAEMTFDTLGAPKIYRWTLQAPLSVQSLLDNETGILYPNPVSETLNIQLHQALNTQALVKVIDAQGKVLKNEWLFIHDSNLNFSVSDLPNGFYHCLIQDKNQVILRQKFSVLR